MSSLLPILITLTTWLSGHVVAATDPLLSVSDFNGDGTVDGRDLKLFQTAIQTGVYKSLFDRNADGALDQQDFDLVSSDIGKASSVFDQELVGWYSLAQNLEHATPAQLLDQGYLKLLASLEGHGEHWQHRDCFSVPQPSTDRICGLNVDQGRVVGVYFISYATPLFQDSSQHPTGLSTLDYPDGKKWKKKCVKRYAEDPPVVTSSPDETWHTHPASCFTMDENSEPFIVTHTTFQDCQADYPNRPGTTENRWSNVYMVHMWMFKLNPCGFFGNLHPCVAQGAKSEDEINGKCEVPDWFLQFHDHTCSQGHVCN